VLKINTDRKQTL